MTPEERFAAKIEVGVCMEWTAATNAKGYGKFALNGGWILAHRWIYEQTVGPIPDGLTVDHLCRNPRCVDPDHMQVVTASTNSLRAKAGTATRNRTADHCIRGHEFSEDNTYRAPSHPDWRKCRTCVRDANRRYREEKQRAGLHG